MFLITPYSQKVIEFLNWVNVMQEQGGQPPVNMKCAVKFLSARKFDVTRAITLFRNHEVGLLTAAVNDVQRAQYAPPLVHFDHTPGGLLVFVHILRRKSNGLRAKMKIRAARAAH